MPNILNTDNAGFAAGMLTGPGARRMPVGAKSRLYFRRDSGGGPAGQPSGGPASRPYTWT
jgi:hypothetical protein